MAEAVRILCVDDELQILRSLQRVFADDPVEVLPAKSAAEALHILRTVQPVQVVMSDYRMPEMNGLDLLAKIADDWPDTVGIILSGYVDLPAVALAMENNRLFRLLPKPWDETVLRQAVFEAVDLFRSRTKTARADG